MAIFEVDDTDFDEIKSEEIGKGNFVLLKFGSELCDACQAIEFELEELDEMLDNVSILYIDCNDSEELAEMYGIQRVPTFFIYNNNNEMIFQHEGVMLCQDILTKMTQ